MTGLPGELPELTPETEAAAAALKACFPSEDEMWQMLQFLCGYSPDAIKAAVESVQEIRALS